MCFKRGAISKPLKLVDQFKYLSSNISSTQIDVNIHIGKVWAANGRLSIIWRYHLSDKIKRDFFWAVAESVLLYGYTTNKMQGDNCWCTPHKNASGCFEHILVVAPLRTTAVRTLTSHLTKYPRKTIKTCWALLENW